MEKGSGVTSVENPDEAAPTCPGGEQSASEEGVQVR